MMREMNTSYGRSYLGYLWSILEPLGGIVVLSLVFSAVMRSPSIGDNFPLFFTSGYLPFQLYQTIQGGVSKAISKNKQLLFYPEVSYIDAILARTFLSVITQGTNLILIFGGIIVVYQLRVHIDPGPMALSILAATILGMGIGTINSVIDFIFPSWSQIWSMLTRPLFIISGVIFLFETLPNWAQDILWYNPLIHVVGEMRIGVYDMYEGPYVSLAYPLLLGAGLYLLGLILLRNKALDMIND